MAAPLIVSFLSPVLIEQKKLGNGKMKTKLKDDEIEK
jgi:hypothetical protein